MERLDHYIITIFAFIGWRSYVHGRGSRSSNAYRRRFAMNQKERQLAIFLQRPGHLKAHGRQVLWRDSFIADGTTLDSLQICTL
jgi:hypothetical protein